MVCISVELMAIIATTIALGTTALVCDHLVRQELRELRASSNALHDQIDAFESGLRREIRSLSGSCGNMKQELP